MHTFEHETADLIRAFVRDMREAIRAYDAGVQAEIATLKSDLARMTAKLQGVRDQVADVPETVPNADEIAARGSQHQAVSKEIQELCERLVIKPGEIIPIDAPGSLSSLLHKLRNMHRPPLPDFPDEPRRVEA